MKEHFMAPKKEGTFWKIRSSRVQGGEQMRVLRWLVFGAASYLGLGLLCELFITRKERK